MIQQTIYPAFTYVDAPAAITWLERAFGFVAETVYPGSDDTIDHAQLRLDNELLLLGSAGPGPIGFRTSPVACGGRGTLAMYVHVDDAGAAFAKATAAGAVIVRPLGGTDYDDSQMFAVEDCERYVWTFGTYAASYETRFAPSLRYAEAKRAIAWLESIGFSVKMVEPNETGGVAHAELTYETGLIMCGSLRDDDIHYGTPATVGGTTGTLYLYDVDPDARFARAQSLGADVAIPLVDREYGSREFCLRDPEGNAFTFGTYRP